MAHRARMVRTVFIAIAVGAAILGWVGIRSHIVSEGGDSGAANVAYGVITLFVAPSLRATGDVSTALRIAQLAALAATGFAVFELLRFAVQERARRVTASRRRGHVAVIGLGDTGCLLATQLARRDEAVVAGIDRAPTPRATELFDRPRWALFAGDATDAAVLDRSGVAEARTAFVATGQDGTSVLVGRELQKVMDRRDRPTRPHIRVQIDSSDLCRRLQQEQLALTGRSRSVIEYVNHEQLTASAVVECISDHIERERGCGPYETLADRLILVGGSRLLTEIQSLLARGHRARLLMGVPPAFTHPPEEVLAGIDPGTEPLPPDDGTVPEVVVVHADDPRDTVMTAVNASRHHSGSHVFALCPTAGPPIVTPARGEVGPLVILDPEQLVQSPELLSFGPVELMARLIHRDYLISQQVESHAPDTDAVPRARRRWEELPNSFKEANRDQARDLGRKVRAIGCELSESGRDPAVLTPAEVEQLARMEHDRWCEERRRAGWTWAETRDDDRRLHPDLRPYDDLSDEAKEKDRRAVRRLHALAALLGLVVVRRPAATSG